MSLAVFIATFVYALTVLGAVRSANEGDGGFVPQFSLLVAYALMGLSVLVLVYFLNHVPASIRINTVIEGIGRRLLIQSARTYPEHDCGLEPTAAPPGAPVSTARTGYIQLIDYADLEEIARELDTTVALKVRTGDFVHPGVTIAEVGGDHASAALGARLGEVLTLGAVRTAAQDPQFLIDELVEIALRALSPAVNDPFTAITALHWMSATVGDIATRDLRRERVGGERVHALPDDFGHYVRRSFGAVRGAVATSPRAAMVMFEAIRLAAARTANAGREAVLSAEMDRLIEQARLVLRGPDLADVERRYARSRADWG